MAASGLSTSRPCRYTSPIVAGFAVAWPTLNARHVSEVGVKITAIEPIAVSLPMKKPVQMAGETVTRADNVLVRIESDDGVVGWGEAASAPTMTGETVAGMMAAVALLTPGLLKRSADDFAGAAGTMDARL